ncbi:MAG: hypothetical protein GX443_03205 [Deltaproteobacteria bacterium]|nr:hypothetical protein [Deltaproteobacteria bacterium]
MPSRMSTRFVIFLVTCVALVWGMLLHAHMSRSSTGHALQERREVIRRFQLSDLCLFTDARYIRHPVAADLHTPFQDYPLSMEHFPSGSLMPVPPHLRRGGGE